MCASNEVLQFDAIEWWNLNRVNFLRGYQTMGHFYFGGPNFNLNKNAYPTSILLHQWLPERF